MGNAAVFRVDLFFHMNMVTVAAGLETGAIALHPRTRACFFCSPAWPTAGFSNHVRRRDEGPEVSHITFPPTLLAAVTTS